MNRSNWIQQAAVVYLLLCVMQVLPTTKASETLAEITEQEKLDKASGLWAIFEVICGDELGTLCLFVSILISFADISV
jgi:hypothetical protein